MVATCNVQPVLWWCPFDRSTHQQMVTYANPTGTITDINLELAASVAWHCVMAQMFYIREGTIHNSSDNMATVWWHCKGVTSNSGPMARLFRLQPLHQLHYWYAPTFDYIVGDANDMADACSRLYHLTASQLIAFFKYSFPQSLPWHLSQLCMPMCSALTWELSTNGYKLALLHNVPRQRITIGPVGVCSVWNAVLTCIAELGMTPSPCSKSSSSGTVMDAWLPAIKPCEFALWMTPSVQWYRCTPDWGSWTHEKTPMGNRLLNPMPNSGVQEVELAPTMGQSYSYSDYQLYCGTSVPHGRYR
jgi:hypothetical protein